MKAKVEVTRRLRDNCSRIIKKSTGPIETLVFQLFGLSCLFTFSKHALLLTSQYVLAISMRAIQKRQAHILALPDKAYTSPCFAPDNYLHQPHPAGLHGSKREGERSSPGRLSTGNHCHCTRWRPSPGHTRRRAESGLPLSRELGTSQASLAILCAPS